MVKPLGQESSTEAVMAQGLSPNAGLSGDSLPASDRRIWLRTIPLAFFVVYAFIPTLANDFVGWDDDKNFLDNPYFRGLAQPRSSGPGVRPGSVFTSPWPGCSSRRNMSFPNSTREVTTSPA